MSADSVDSSDPPRWAHRPWARPVRRCLLGLIGLLYAASIPWYRGAGPTDRLLGLPDWVGVAVLCYAAVAVLNAAAWLITDVPDPEPVESELIRTPAPIALDSIPFLAAATPPRKSAAFTVRCLTN